MQTLGDVVTVRHGRFRIEKGHDPSVRIQDFVLKCVAFVGEVTHRDATGVSGDLLATGFFVSVPCEDAKMQAQGACAVYFVTAKHVATDLAGRDAYFLVNDLRGGTTTFDRIMGDRWWFHPTDSTADVAVGQVWPHRTADIISVSLVQLAGPEMLKGLDIGIGDEIYVTGLFTPAPGTARNIPIVRHGNIAMMPTEQIQTELGYADVYLVEARSLGGISGSPVFVRPTIDFKISDRKGRPRDAFAAGLGFPLLGLMHGHWDIRESEINKAFFDQDRKRGVNLGIGIVVPAIKILETINQEELVAIRREGERLATRKMTPGTDSVKSKERTSPFTKQEFETALKKASRKVVSRKGE